MFRATGSMTTRGFVLKLEGQLSGAMVRELDSCWRQAMHTHETDRIFVDLSELYFVDPGGRDLLTDMYRAGVTFVTTGCEMPELLREISSGTATGERDRALINS